MVCLCPLLIRISLRRRRWRLNVRHAPVHLRLGHVRLRLDLLQAGARDVLTNEFDGGHSFHAEHDRFKMDANGSFLALVII